MGIIAVNGRFLTQKTTGVQRYACEIVSRLAKLYGDEMVVFTPTTLVEDEKTKGLNIQKIGSGANQKWEQWDLPRHLKKIGSPVLLCLCGVPPVSYDNKVMILHDLGFAKNSQTYSMAFVMWYKFMMRKAVRSAKKIVTVSQYSKRDIESYYNIKGLEVAYNGVGELFWPEQVESMQREKYLLCVSSMAAHKNFKTALAAFEEARKTITDLKLYIIGDITEKQFADQSHIIDKLTNHSEVKLIGRVGDDMLRKYYSNALAFVFPSYFEGFGIPLIEAQACGCPVVSSNACSMPEVGGDGALFSSPFDTMDFAKHIIEIAHNEDLRKDLVEKGFANHKQFSWDASAEKIKKILDKYK